MKTHIEKIDFFRGIAILLVFVYHSSLVIFPGYQQVVLYTHLRDYLLNYAPSAFGGTGVQLFLVISGFLIHYGTIRNNLKFENLKFFNKRFWRIWPPYILALSFFYMVIGSYNHTDFFTHFFLVHNLFDKTIFTINPSFWSLALEAQLYLIYPIYLFLYKKYGNNKSFFIIAIISLSFLIAQFVFNINTAAYGTSVFKNWIVWIMGAYLADVFYNKKRVSKIKGWQLIVLYFLVIAPSHAGATLSNLFPLFSNYLFAAFYTLLIDWYLNKETGNKSNFIYKIIVSTGICSYSIYLFHQPFLYQSLFFFHFGFFSFLIMVPLVFAFYYIVSMLLHKYIELPSIQFGSKFYNLIKRNN
jgi:peptidoglycan/LPS O-acetylase OafA/YrhL